MKKLFPLLLAIFTSSLLSAQNVFDLNVLGSYQSGIFDEGAAEIVAYDPGSQRLFTTNADANNVTIISIADPANPDSVGSIDMSPYGAGLTSLKVVNGIVAVASEADSVAGNGSLTFFNAADGSFVNSVEVGVLPDMVQVNAAGTKVLTANEGQPSDDYTVDPEGSVSIVDISGGAASATVTTITFDSFNDKKAALMNRGIRIFGPGATVAQDLEPEYITVAPNDSIAYVVCQENNAFAVININTGSLLDILALGYKDHYAGQPVLEEFFLNELIDLPSLGTPVGQEDDVKVSGFSGLFFDAANSSSSEYVFYVIPDRGPNEGTVSGSAAGTSQNLRPFKIPDYQARIVKFTMNPSTKEISFNEDDQIFLTQGENTPISGRGNIPGFDEVPVALELDTAVADVVVDGRGFNFLDYDPFGGDFEGILRDANGDFWMCDEYRPAIYHFDASGVMVDRFVPEGTSMLGDSAQEAGFYGTETLPAVYAKRRANRGFEALALDTDEGILYAFIQSPIENPDRASVRNMSDVIRILGVDPATGEPVSEYVYLLERNRDAGLGNRVDKMGDAVYVGNGRFMVLERDSGLPGDNTSQKYVFEIDLKYATNILGTDLANKMESTGPEDKTLEMMTADDLAAAEIAPVYKRKVLNLPSIGYLPSDKPEGLAVLPDGSLAVINDNDFGLAGAGVTDDISLGIISFDGANGFDASNRSDGIDIRPRPTLGMFQPDAIASYEVDGLTYIVTANEGDSREYEDEPGFVEDTRVEDLTLDTLEFPNAAALQAEENLGRLKTTDASGDLDGDGDFDRIFSYGARSFAIFDQFGNLVFDSGDDFEQITAALEPLNFNSTNDENDSRKNRSDDKGVEPEAINIVERDGQVYALIGFERMGGIIIYNITDPTNPEYLSYINNRDFSADAETPAVGDLGIEDIIYIDAEDSPNGSPLVVTANEVSGSVTVFGTAFEKQPLSLRVIHNNDGESRLLPDDNGIGGAAPFKTISDSLKAIGTPYVMLSSGDNFLAGKAFEAGLNRAEGLPLYDAVVLDSLGYDAICIGNHDFDFGPDILAQLIGDFATTMPPYLSANMDVSGEPALAELAADGRIAKTTIVDLEGEKVGIVGLITPLLANISSPRNVAVSDMVLEIAQQEVDAMTAIGINKIIVISHLQSIQNEIDLAGELRDVDVIIAGGGDELLTNDSTDVIEGLEIFGSYPLEVANANGDTTYIVTTPGEYRFVGNLVVNFDEAGKVTSIGEESDPILVQGAAADAGLQSTVIDSIIAYNAFLEANIIASTEVDLDGTRNSVRTIETNEGNLITDAYVWLVERDAEELGLDSDIPIVAMTNGGGIRNNNIIEAGSDISEGTTFDMLPFDNIISVVNPLTPIQLKSALENSVSSVETGSGRFSQISGFSFVWDTTGVPGERRVISATLNDGTKIIDDYLPLQGAPSVYVVTNSFVARGGDSYDEFPEAGFQNIGLSYRQALFDYLVAADGVNAVITEEDYPAGGEGRIVRSGPVDAGSFALRIIHNNDGESKLTPNDGFGGAANFLTITDSLKATSLSEITLSSGDNFLAGTAFAASLARDTTLPFYDAVVLDSIGYDAICIGNHDFDFGPELLADFINDFVTTQPPYLSANLDFSGEPSLDALVTAGRIAPRTIVEVDGEQIGVIGLITESLPTVSSPGNVAVDSALMEIAQAQIDALIGEGVNKIILISHLQSIQNEISLVSELSGVDIVIAGGGDELLTNDTTEIVPGQPVFGEYPLTATDADNNTVYIVTTPGEYQYVGNLMVNFDSTGAVSFIADGSNPILVRDGNPDSALVATVIDSVVAYEDILDQNIIAVTEVDLDGRRTSVRSIETNEGNMIADAFLWVAKKEGEALDLDASIPIVAIQNGGGIRNNNIIEAGSDISEGSTFDMLPFPNFVSIVNPISPEEFKSVMENAVSQIEFGAGRFAQIAGFKMVYNPSGEPGVSRVLSLMLEEDSTMIVEEGTVVDGAPSVYVVTNSFTAAGGDDFDEFSEAGSSFLAPSYQRALFDYLIAEDGVNGVITEEQYPAGGEGRITTMDIPTSRQDQLNLHAYNFKVYPNPFSEKLAISYELVHNQKVRIQLLDMMGRTVSTLVNDVQSSGSKHLEIRQSELAAGVYLLQIQIGDRLNSLSLLKK